MRLQKYLAMCGVASRRRSEEYIKEERVYVNSQLITEMGFKVEETDEVRVDGKLVTFESKKLLLFNKPKGVITTLKDPQGRRDIQDYLKNYNERFFPIGRLDADTTGLLLLTTDGDLAQYLAHPSFKIIKEYNALLDGVCTNSVINKLKKGIELEDGLVQADVKIIKKSDRKTEVIVKIHIGRKRIVRRMFKELGLPVLELKRLKHGPFSLDELRVGQIIEVDYSKLTNLRS
ncbi:UNVERIFIED_CONTAM: hypothetical protein GTU68_066936 [Idotea baltica]|nr:hypothetical protein [Idotea baltica]